MRKYHKNQRNTENGIENIVPAIGALYLSYMVLLYLVDRANFWRWLRYGIAILIVLIVLMLLWYKLKAKEQKSKKERILTAIRQAGLEDHVNNFITRFGLGQEKSKNAWTRRTYTIDWNRIHDLQGFLATKDIKFSLSDISVLLAHNIDEREYEVTSSSISVGTHSFDSLSGTDFEKLLYRLYVAMGYSVQLTGKTGDQGGDLVATKGEERIVIQAKCYTNLSVGNRAVQEAVAARSHYDCKKAIVIATSSFTREAIQLAKTNSVELIPKELIKKKLLDTLKESWS